MSNETEYTSYRKYQAGEMIWKTVPPVLIILGTVGNVLAIIVLTRKSTKSSTTALYLTVLAISDLVVLYSGLLRQWLKYLVDMDVRDRSAGACKIAMWILYTSSDISSWILVAVTFERVVCVWLPHKAKLICTRKTTVIVLSMIFVFLLLLNSHFIYGMGFKYVVNETVVKQVQCSELYSDYEYFVHHTWPWIDLCTFCVVPCGLIIIGNTLILLKMFSLHRKSRSRIAPSSNSEHTRKQSYLYGKQSSMTAMLLTLNIVFLVSTSPVTIYNAGHTKWENRARKNNDNSTLAELWLWWAIVGNLMYANNSLNFFLYCLSGTKFRREVKKFFCTLTCTWKCKSKVVPLSENGGPSGILPDKDIQPEERNSIPSTSAPKSNQNENKRTCVGGTAVRIKVYSKSSGTLEY